MDYFNKKQKNDFNNKVSKIFNLLSISGKYNLVGSSTLKSILYNSDFDLNELFEKSKDSKKMEDLVYHLFLKKYEYVDNDPNSYITDFKFGINSDGSALRWKKKDVYNGYIVLKNKQKLTFQDCLKIKATMKIDLISLINGYFTEFSEVYYIKLGDMTNYNDNEFDINRIMESLKDEAKSKLEEGNYLKSLKRLFSYMLIKNKKKYKNKLTKLIQFFNSSVGIINKMRSECEILNILLDNKFKPVNINDIKTTLQIMKASLANVFDVDLGNISNILNNICSLTSKREMRNEIEKVQDFLYKINNNLSLDFINKNKNLYNSI